MTRPKRNDEPVNLTKQELLRALTTGEALKNLAQTTLLQEVLESKMDKALQAFRFGYCSGHYRRSLVPRVGKLELRVPQDR